MKRTLKYFGAILGLVVLFGFAYGFGYYRGVTNSSLKATSFQLSVHEMMFDAIKKGYIDRTAESLRVVIWGEAQSLRKLRETPLVYLHDEIIFDRSGNINKQLEKADEITKGMYPDSPGANSK